MSYVGGDWRCGGFGPVDCLLGSLSEWGPCTTICGVGGKQTSTRRRLIREQCGGTCPGAFNLTITRACPQIRCLNGGSLMNGACICKAGYSGDCCEDVENTKKGKAHSEIWITAFVIYIDFHSTKRALWFVDSWSRAPDHIQMYPDRDTIAQLLPAHGKQQHVCFCHIGLFKGKSNNMKKSTWSIFPRETSCFFFFSSPDLSKRSG